MTFHLRVMYQVAIGWRWGSTPPWSAFWPWHFLNQLKPFWGSKHVLFELVFAKRHFTRHTWQELVFAKRHFTRHTWQSTFPNPSHPTLGSHEAPKSLFMLHFWPDPSHPTLGNHEAPKPFFMLHFFPSQAFPTPLLGTMRNARTPFHVSLLAFPSPSHPTLGNHDYMNSGFRSPLLRYIYIYIANVQ